MIKVVAKHTVDENRIDEFLAMSKELIELSQKDAGNIFYTLNRNIQQPNAFAIIEAWESMDALKAHMEAEHFQRLVPQMAPLYIDGAPIEIYEEV